jgi:hypothetical protein
MGPVYSGHLLDGQDVIVPKVDTGESIKVHMGNFLYQRTPLVILYILHALQTNSLLTFHSVMRLI